MQFIRQLMLSTLLLICLLANAVAQELRPNGLAGKDATKENRVALVIGNADYKSSPLKNPVNDARDMADSLRSLGFTVIQRENLTIKQIGPTLREFRSRLSPGSVALFFYAGHGLQVKGNNYLPVVDAEITGEEDVSLQSLEIGKILDLFEQNKTRLNLIFLDACRNNPFARGFRSTASGLSKVDAPSGTLISFATRPGSVASDGTGKNGLYTEKLLLAMNEVGLPIESTLKRVVTAVKAASKGAQEPWMEGSIEGEFYFRPSQVPVAATVQAALVLAPPAQDAEMVLWGEVKANGSKAYLNAYLNEYPRGKFAAIARLEVNQIEDREKERVQKANQDLELALAAQKQAADKVALEKRKEEERIAAQRQRELEEAAKLARDMPAGKVLRDCPQCPELIVVPAGSFVMGSDVAEPGRDRAEEPVHPVKIRSFAVSRFAITKAEFDEFLKAKKSIREPALFGGCPGFTLNLDKSFFGFSSKLDQGQNHPAVCVSWEDAKEYAQWLGEQSGKPYRLLTESEFEYVTRAGTQTPFWWGDNISAARANYNANLVYRSEPGGTFRKNTLPVEAFEANAFGLFNVHGNASSWVEDCWHDNYVGAPDDGSAWTKDCAYTYKVYRGGSWFDHPASLRSANRSWSLASSAYSFLGLRLARALQ